MGYSNVSADDLQAWVALETGIFSRHNLTVNAQLIAGGASTTAALISGQIQISQAGGSEALSATANGADVVAVATVSGVYPYLFSAAPEIKTIQELKGKKVGVSNIGGSADVAARVVLRQNGLDPETDVTIIATGSAQNRTSAMLSGAIQAGMTAPPENLAVEAAGFHTLLDLAGQHLPAANTVVTVQRSFLNQNRDVVQRYIDSIIEANVQLKKDKPGTIATLKKYFQSNDDHAMEVTYDFFANEVLEALPFPRPEQFKDSVEALSATNPRVKDVDLNKLVDPSLVQNAADRAVGK